MPAYDDKEPERPRSRYGGGGGQEPTDPHPERPRNRYGGGGGQEAPEPPEAQPEPQPDPPAKKQRTFGGRKSKGHTQRTFGGKSAQPQDDDAGSPTPASPPDPPKPAKRPKPPKTSRGGGSGRPLPVTLALCLTLLAGLLSLLWGGYLFAALMAIGAEEETPGWVDDGLLTLYQDEIHPWIMEEYEASSGGMTQQEAIEEVMLVFGAMAGGWAVIMFLIYMLTAWLGPFTGPVGKVIASLWFLGSLSLVSISALSTIGAMLGFAIIGTSLAAGVLIWLAPSLQYIRGKKASRMPATRYST